MDPGAVAVGTVNLLQGPIRMPNHVRLEQSEPGIVEFPKSWGLLSARERLTPFFTVNLGAL